MDMTEEQITMLRRLIKDEIDAAQIDGMEHGQWGWAEKQLDEGWKQFQESMDMTHEEMLEEAERREKLNAGFKQDADGNWYRPTLQELTRNERIDLAEKEIAYVVMGGQDGREYANSIAFILDVLNSLRE